MGKRGPLPTPGSRRSEAGVYGKPRQQVEERVRIPKRVAARKDAAEFWKRLAPRLSEELRLSPVHVDEFAQLAMLHADCIELEALVAVHGWVDAEGKATGAARLLRDARRDYTTVQAKFGLTPADEGRLPQEDDDEDEEEDPVAKFMPDYKG
jgi:phage terminase small subunit